MNGNNLTPEERMALGLPMEEEIQTPLQQEPIQKQPVKRGRPPKNSLQSAKAAMLDSFATEEPISDFEKERNIDGIKLDDVLKNVKIDVNKVKIVDKSIVERFTNANIKINGRPTFEVVCNQSGYVAHVESLKYSDLSALENSTGGLYAQKQRIYKTIYNKINSTSLGDLTYEQFLKITSLFDIPSLEYGVYCQTFKTESEFTVVCPHCEKPSDIKVNNKELLVYKDQNAFDNVQNILGSVSLPDDAMKNAAVNIRNRILLPESKMMIDIKLPTLYKYLEIIGSVNPNMFEEVENIVGLMIFIDKVFKLDVNKLIETGEVEYYEIKYEEDGSRDLKREREEIAKIISDLELDDSLAIQLEIKILTNLYSIEIGLKGFNCPKCGKFMDKRILDIEETLFFKLEQMQQIQ